MICTFFLIFDIHVGKSDLSSMLCHCTSLPPANEVWGKVIFLHLFVILFTGGGLPQCMLGYHPPGPGAHTPPAQSMLGDTVNARAVRILLECYLVFYKLCKLCFIKTIVDRAVCNSVSQYQTIDVMSVQKF